MSSQPPPADLPLQCFPLQSTSCGDYLPYNSTAAYGTERDSLPVKDKAMRVFLQTANEDESCGRWVGALCNVIFPECVTGSDGSVFRAPLCLSDCQRMNEQCPALAALGESASALSIKCDEMVFPDRILLGNDYLGLNNETVVRDDITYAGSNGTSTVVQCTSPLDQCNVLCADGLLPEGPLNVAGCPTCAGQCPPRIFSDSNQTSLRSVWDMGGWVNVGCSLLMLFMWVGQPRRRKVPSRFILYFSVCMLLMSVAMTFGGLRGHDEMQCASKVVWQGDQDGLCVVQAVLWMVGILGMTGWWLAFCVALVLLIVQQKPSSVLERNEWVFHACVWPIPILVAIISTAAADVGYDPGGLTCFISTKDTSSWQLLFWIPLCMMVAAGTVMMVIVGVEVFRSSRVTRNWQSARIVSRFFAFIPLYWVMAITYLVYSQGIVGLPSDYTEAVSDYVNCTIYRANFTVVGDDVSRENYAACREETLYSITDFGFDMFTRVMLSVVGVVVLLVFGAQRSNGTWWIWLFKRCFCLTKLSFLESVSTGKTRSTRSTRTRTRTRTNTAGMSKTYTDDSSCAPGEEGTVAPSTTAGVELYGETGAGVEGQTEGQTEKEQSEHEHEHEHDDSHSV